MRVRLAVVLLTAATPFTLLMAQSAGARRPAPTPDTRRPATGTEKRTPEATVAVAPARARTETNTSIGLRVGTAGVGLDVAHLLGDHIGVRVGASYLTANHTRTIDDAGVGIVRWAMTVKGTSFSGLLDLYPGRRGVFRLSAGAIRTPLKGSAVGTIVSAGYIMNNRSYNASEVGNLLASGGYLGVLPYAGIGFGTPASQHNGVGFICDLGVAIGRPTVALTSTTAATTTSPTLRQDLVVKQRQWQTETLDRIPIYPVLNLGVAYRF